MADSKTKNLEFFANLYPKPEELTKDEEPKPPAKGKKFLTVLLITLAAAFIYSGTAYTVSSILSDKFDIEMFDSIGRPSKTIIAIHSVIFILILYIIFYVMKVKVL